MRRPRSAAAFVLTLGLALAPAAAAAPRAEGFDLGFFDFLIDFFAGAPAVETPGQPESAVLAAGLCSDPSGLTAPPGPSCPLPPPPQALAAPGDSDY